MSFKKLINLILLLPLGLAAQSNKPDAAFRKLCSAVLTAFARQDFKTLNKYVDNATGVYVITRPGAIDALNRYDSLSTQSFAFYPYKDPKCPKKLILKMGAAPKFDCGTEMWNKSGFYADTARYNRLSELMEFLTKNEMGAYTEEQLKKAKDLETRSRKIVYTELAKKHGLVFYLTLINNKWRLTLVDAVAGDCGA